MLVFQYLDLKAVSFSTSKRLSVSVDLYPVLFIFMYENNSSPKYVRSSNNFKSEILLKSEDFLLM